ncbi:methyl-accepting chemotaxis protein [Pseudomonas protegens]|jgi:methyl-accepting chemotaxis protein|uniref:Biofilm dispersion protein BdlA n=2 Tax=Pseudomonas protegens TaxID=380021 RepID=A0A2C9EKJ5_PSEPH|nr:MULTISPECIES: methyl-accepting chemotaxis protein [Pseudomonas]AGL84164.1 biofilm dispersion protein BdlA [Pseudomonas protegens CHA0]MBP5113581.1 methyl-accepting chemotaxis protein [Pseudomonas protegens]MCS4259900.1 methyl-accepting chemotaxis protein [Pseudomonas sp. BIGb0176]MDT3422483.1 methyl-accepting chemotaxis protein [Pseudomonas protegens]MDX9680902.1 methyl-accepting chemotaxis protein [Pseudomonas protegens]
MFSNLSISQKLYAGFGVVLLILLLLVLAALRGFDQVSSSVKSNIHSYEVLSQSDALLRSLINIETGMRGYALTGRDSFLEPLEQGEKAFTDYYARIKSSTADNPEQQARLERLKALHDQWLQDDVQGNLALRRAINAGSRPAEAMAAQISAGRDKAKMDAMRQLTSELREAEKSLQDARSQAMDAAKSSALAILIGGGLLAAVLAMLVAWSLSSNLVGRIRQAVEVAKAIAAGRLDSSISVTGRDEVSNLLQAFAAMQERLRTMISQIKLGADQLVSASQSISSASLQLSASAQEQSHSASSMAATVEELTVSINHVADNAGDAHALSSESGRQSEEGGSVIQDTLGSMRLIAETVQASATQIGELGQHAEQISSIVSVIKGIAEQTNLLALNAAIEAARAGEQGRGFAVVADEVRLLAQRTANSTQEITEMVDKIQLGTREAVSSMDVGVNQVKSGVELAQQAGEAIVNIRTSSGNVVRVVDQISLALREQTAASQDVARNVERIAQMSQQNSQAVEETTETARSLQQLAQNLEQQVNVFRL